MCAVAYDYKTGEILVCTSLPSLDVTKGYSGIADFETGTLISKVMYGTVPGSTQKVSTLLSAFQIMGRHKLFPKTRLTRKEGRRYDKNGIKELGETS